MQSKLITISFMIVSLVFAIHAYAAEKAKAKVAPISESMAEELLANQKLKTQNAITAVILDKWNGKNQSFKINIASKVFYIVSSKRKAFKDYPSTCTIILFDKSKKFLSAVDTFPPVDYEESWVCEGAAAISFRDYYTDGSLKIIALYNGTPPSNERFVSPVILKLDINKATLSIDELLTSKFDDDHYVETIGEARKVLNRR